MPTNDLEQYYNYSVRDDSEIKKELKYKRNDKISTAAAYITVFSLVLTVIAAILAKCLNSTPFAIIGSVLFAVMIISLFVGMFFSGDLSM